MMNKITSSLVKCIGSYSKVKYFKSIQRCSLSTSSALQYKWEPDDLKIGPERPEYPNLIFKSSSYEYRVLENFHKFLHNSAMNMDLDCDVWALPCTKLEIASYKSKNKIKLDEFTLNKYCRVIQFDALPSTSLHLLIEMIRPNIPSGVTLSIQEFSEADEEFKYVPDYNRDKLQGYLGEIDTARYGDKGPPQKHGEK